MAENKKVRGVAYERVSSREQAEGYSLDAQGRERSQYAAKKDLEVLRVWSVQESAKDEGRKAFNEMIEFVKSHPEVKVILVEKIDRLIRNFGDVQTIFSLVKSNDIEVHFYHENWVFHKNSPTSDYYRLGFMTVVATGNTYDQRDKTIKGMNEKALQGELPGRAPRGYTNDKATKLITVNSEWAPWAKRIKELSAVALYSLDKIKDILISEGYPLQRHRLHRNQIERIIRDPLYAGYLEWPKHSGTLIKGKHDAIVSWELHINAVRGLQRFNRPRYRKWNFTYAGMLHCGLCPAQRAIVFEMKKKVNLYGHCTGVRKAGLCPDSEYVREEVIESEVLNILRGVQITEDVAAMILAEMSLDTGSEAAQKLAQVILIKQEIGRLENRIRTSYIDKTDGVITEKDWRVFNTEWQSEKVRLTESARSLDESGPSSYLPTVRKMLELSKRLDKLFFSATSEEKRELVNFVCSNLILRGKKVDFIYKKPFDLLAEGLHSAKWLRD